MIDSIELIFIIVIGCLAIYLLVLIMNFVKTMCEDISKIKKELSDYDYKCKESKAEEMLAEEETDNEESIYRNKQGLYSYKALKENKLRKEQNATPQEFIDDYEMLAETLEKEKVNRYGR